MWILHSLVSVKGSQGAGDPGQANQKMLWISVGITWRESHLHQSSHSPAAALHHLVRTRLLSCPLRGEPSKMWREENSAPATLSRPHEQPAMASQLWRLGTPCNAKGPKWASVTHNKLPGSVSMEKNHCLFRPRNCWPSSCILTHHTWPS